MLGRGLAQRFWGSFGWYSVRFSTGLAYTLSAVLVAVVVAAFFASLLTGRVGGRGRPEAFVGAGARDGTDSIATVGEPTTVGEPDDRQRG